MREAEIADLSTVGLSTRRGESHHERYYDEVAPFRKIVKTRELLDLVLDRLVPMKSNLVPPEGRNSLSQESFAAFPPFPDIAQLGIFRLICPACSHAGIGRQFARVVIRFSSEGLERLRWLSHDTQRHLVREVKQFSYMIPRFYPQAEEQFLHLLQHIGDTPDNPPGRRAQDMDLIKAVMVSSNSQRSLIENQLDLRELRAAMRKFEILQQIRLMKVEDQLTARWIRFLHRYPQYADTFRPAPLTHSFMHASNTLSTATMELKNPITRFSSRFMDPALPLVLTADISARISECVGNLSYLEQEFRDDAGHLEEKLLGLAPLFRVIWTAAHNLQGLHVGFTHRLSVPLHTVFHHVHLTKLKHFGIHLWYLEEAEILEFLQRHKDSLQSIRLRYISLRTGHWKNILEYIRLNLKLRWISLRGVGYDSGPPDFSAMGFAPPVTIGHLQHDSDADTNLSWDLDSTTEDDSSSSAGSEHELDSFEESSEPSSHGSIQDVDEYEESHHTSENQSLDGSDGESERVEEHESDIEEFHGVTIGDHPLQEAPLTSSTCECAHGYAFTDLEDNSLAVTPDQWKRWEKWCRKRCVLHDPS